MYIHAVRVHRERPIQRRVLNSDGGYSFIDWNVKKITTTIIVNKTSSMVTVTLISTTNSTGTKEHLAILIGVIRSTFLGDDLNIDRLKCGFRDWFDFWMERGTKQERRRKDTTNRILVCLILIDIPEDIHNNCHFSREWIEIQWFIEKFSTNYLWIWWTRWIRKNYLIDRCVN